MKTLIVLLFNLLKDLLIKNEDELSFKSSKFDGRKVILLVFIFAQILFSTFAIYRLCQVVLENISLQEQLIQCKETPSNSPKKQSKASTP